MRWDGSPSGRGDSMTFPWKATGASVMLVVAGIRVGSAQVQVSTLGTGTTSAAWSVAAVGNVVHAVYWRSVASGNEEIFYARSLNGGGIWQPEVQLTHAMGS